MELFCDFHSAAALDSPCSDIKAVPNELLGYFQQEYPDICLRVTSSVTCCNKLMQVSRKMFKMCAPGPRGENGFRASHLKNPCSLYCTSTRTHIPSRYAGLTEIRADFAFGEKNKQRYYVVCSEAVQNAENQKIDISQCPPPPRSAVPSISSYFSQSISGIQLLEVEKVLFQARDALVTSINERTVVTKKYALGQFLLAIENSQPFFVKGQVDVRAEKQQPHDLDFDGLGIDDNIGEAVHDAPPTEVPQLFSDIFKHHLLTKRRLPR